MRKAALLPSLALAACAGKTTGPENALGARPFVRDVTALGQIGATPAEAVCETDKKLWEARDRARVAAKVAAGLEDGTVEETALTYDSSSLKSTVPLKYAEVYGVHFEPDGQATVCAQALSPGQNPVDSGSISQEAADSNPVAWCLRQLKAAYLGIQPNGTYIHVREQSERNTSLARTAAGNEGIAKTGEILDGLEFEQMSGVKKSHSSGTQRGTQIIDRCVSDGFARKMDVVRVKFSGTRGQ
ncbi:hypothetical protein COV82_05980 [Candidatus Peregrinibacteria bacterium CG11_big_fil_rev_8_21_14_0_20_46_8]|nr:MAG: hypothetical protein COV82_05980 [Candidatus Peregrinibacteria bacterium CG11_big_fil_rev_8_21_14_0_20_46_8]